MSQSKRPATATTDGNTALKLLQEELPGETVRVGGLPAGATLLQDFRLPVLPFGPTTMVLDAFHQATEERKMVAVIGDRGVGKSMAVDRAIEAFEETEFLRNQADASLPLRRV